MISLYDWQQPFADRLHDILVNGRIAVNTSETGTGKTYMGAYALKKLGLPVLVVAPKSVLTDWKNVAALFELPLLDVVNWEKLQRGNTPWYSNRWNLPGEPCVILIDEAHQGCSGPKSITNRTVAQLKAFGKVKTVVQSATLADSPLKMRGLGYLLDLHQFNDSSFWSWCRKHGCLQPPYHKGLEFTKGAQGQEIMREIHKQIASRMVRARIAEIPGFPECALEAKLYDIGTKYTREINAIRAALEVRLKEPHIIPMVERNKARERIELFKVPLLIDLAKETLEAEHSPVIFVNFRSTVEALHKAFPGASIIIGEQTDRVEQIRRFQANESTVCLATCGAGGVGVSLHDVRHERPREAFITPGDRADHLVQVKGRIWRAGGTKAVQQFVLIAGTVEEKVYKNIQYKLGNLESLNDGDLFA